MGTSRRPKRQATTKVKSEPKRIRPRKEEQKTLSKLESLPYELRWNIIEYAPECIHDLRLTSRIMQSSVDEYALQPANIQLVKFLLIRSFHSHAMGLDIEIPNTKAKLFEHRLKIRDPPHPWISRLRRNNRFGNTTIYYYSFGLLEEDTNVLTYLGDCMGKSIELFILNSCKYSEAYDAVAKLMDGIRIKKMEFNAYNRTYASYEINFIQKISQYVHELKLAVESLGNSVAEDFLLVLADRVSSLHIEQWKLDDVDVNSPSFLGVSEVKWGPIILEMFSRKVDKLWIDNTEYPNFLKKGCAELLKEKLPIQEKKIWLSTNCVHYPVGIESKNENGCMIEIAKDSDEPTTSLRIIHMERIHENFQDKNDEDEEEEKKVEEEDDSEYEQDEDYEESDDE